MLIWWGGFVGPGFGCWARWGWMYFGFWGIPLSWILFLGGRIIIGVWVIFCDFVVLVLGFELWVRV